MYNPYETNNYNNPDMNGQEPSAPVNTPQPGGYQTPPANGGWSSGGYNPTQTTWQDGSYRSGPIYPAYQTPSYQNPGKPPKQKKDRSKLKKSIGKAVACVLAVCVISAGSIGAFTGLVNGGYVKLSGGTENSAFQITKYLNSDGSTAGSSTEMSKQDIAAKVIPSVVCIENYQTVNQAQNPFSEYFGQGNGGSTQRESDVSPASEGSGIIATADGYIITNAHVVEGAEKLGVILSDGTKYEAKLIGSDSITDLAVIKIEATGLTAAEFGSSADMRVADTVMAVGNPGGSSLSSSVTIGYVSALNREITDQSGYTMKTIQTDAAINPGNSGGALVNMHGQVIGINSSKIAAAGYEGLGFAIPIDDAQPVISSLKQNGYVKDRAVIGITGVYADAITASMNGLPSTGFYISSISNESVTASGITKGCIITKIDDKDITAQSVMTNVINSKKPGDTVTLTVTHGVTGEVFTAKVTLAQATGE